MEPEPFTAALLQAALILGAIRAIDIWEREPFPILIAMALWGAVGATALAVFGNEVVGRMLLSPDVRTVWGPALHVPLVEELAKGVCLISALYLSRVACRHFGIGPQFDGPTDGMVYGAAVGLGFAFAENNLVFLNQAFVTVGKEALATREGFLNLNTLGHAVYTGVFGAGLGLATWSRTVRRQVAVGVAGFAAAMLLHTVHNGLTSYVLVDRFGLDATAAFYRLEPLPFLLVERMEETISSATLALLVADYAFSILFLAALVAWVIHQRRVLSTELSAETALGTISVEERDAVVRIGRRARTHLLLLRSGHLAEFRARQKRSRALVALAFARWRMRVAGGDLDRIETLREELKDQMRSSIQARSSKPATQA